MPVGCGYAGLRNHAVDQDPDPSTEIGNFLGRKRTRLAGSYEKEYGL